MKIRAIIFDYDGVIHNTFNFHREKVKEFTGVLLSESEYRDMHNGNFFDNKNNRLQNVDWPSYRDFIYDLQSKLKIENEIKNTLLELSKTHELFIVTSGGNKNISDYLKNNGIAKIFKEVLGLESHRSKVDKFNYIFKKHSLAPDDCIFVTDTLGDILEANELGIKTIAVDFGYHPRETLEKGRPFKIISQFSAILDTINLL
jgi:HAD superfamily hydrolase (TIGR01509 family)